MTDRAANLSIKSLFLWAVMSISTVSLIITSGLSVYTQIETYRHELESNILTLSTLIARNASHSLQNDDPGFLENRLRYMSSVPQVLNIHIYQNTLAAQGSLSEIQSFSSYNKKGQLLIAGQQNNLVLLENNPRLSNTGDYIEMSRKIYEEGSDRLLGWIYLRLSSSEYNQLVNDAILLNVAVLITLLVIIYIVALRLQRLITWPINSLSLFLQKTSRQRDYSVRAELSNIKELAQLSEAVNVMLSRMQTYMQKQRQAEEQQKKLNSSLEEMVNQRTIALKDANQELIQTLEKLHQFQRQIVQNEKMASLGDMVAGIAHEVNTPIGLGVTASTMMLDRLGIIEKDFNNKTLKASAMQRFIDESNENLNIIYRNLNRAAELISSFKQVAVDQSSENSRTFCFAQLVNEILLSLQPRLKKLKHTINVECDPTLNVETKAGPINQILINLIMNSVIHGFENIEKGQIDICAELISKNKLKLIYRDNGKGIPADIRKRIFDPFVTTKRGQGGSGLGMHLVYNLVTQGLNGSITLLSEEGNGVEFVIVFPVVNAKSA